MTTIIMPTKAEIDVTFQDRVVNGCDRDTMVTRHGLWVCLTCGRCDSAHMPYYWRATWYADPDARPLPECDCGEDMTQDQAIAMAYAWMERAASALTDGNAEKAADLTAGSKGWMRLAQDLPEVIA